MSWFGLVWPFLFFACVVPGGGGCTRLLVRLLLQGPRVLTFRCGPDGAAAAQGAAEALEPLLEPPGSAGARPPAHHPLPRVGQ